MPSVEPSKSREIPLDFTADLYKEKMDFYMLVYDETPMNQRDKSVMRSMLDQNDLPRVRTLVGEVTDAVLDAAEGSAGWVDLVGDISRRVPAHLVERYFGFHHHDHSVLIRWSRAVQFDTYHNQPFDGRLDHDQLRQQNEDANREMKEYLAILVRQKLTDLQGDPEADDIFSHLLRTKFPESIGSDMERLVINIGGLLIGAIETASQAVAQIIDQLLDQPEMLDSARQSAAGDHRYFDMFCWEALRFKASLPYFFRIAGRDYTLGRGTDRAHSIASGTTVLPLVMSAIFDQRAVESPEAFCTDRSPYLYELHLGYGHHRCLGDHVAKVMIAEITRRVLLRDICRAAGADGQLDFQGGPFPERMILELGTA